MVITNVRNVIGAFAERSRSIPHSTGDLIIINQKHTMKLLIAGGRNFHNYKHW